MTKPRKKREPAAGFDPAALDALLGERCTPGEVDELFRQMKKALISVHKENESRVGKDTLAEVYKDTGFKP